MKLSDLDFLLKGSSGILGNRVYYQCNGKTLNRKRTAGYNKIPSPAQAPIRAAFRLAMAAIKERFKDPAVKAAYRAKAKPGQTEFNVALGEMLAQRPKAQPGRVLCAVCVWEQKV